MNKLLTGLINNYDGEENEEFFSAGRIRLAALAICLLCFGAGLLFTDWLSLLKGLFLGYAVAALLFRQHELSNPEKCRQSKPHGIFYTNAYPGGGNFCRSKKSRG